MLQKHRGNRQKILRRVSATCTREKQQIFKGPVAVHFGPVMVVNLALGTITPLWPRPGRQRPLHLARSGESFPRENRRRRMCHPQWWTERSGKRTGNRPIAFERRRAFPTGERLLLRQPTEGANLHRQANLSGKKDSRGSPWFLAMDSCLPLGECHVRCPCPLAYHPAE